MATLILKRGAERRIRAGHPWVYRGEVADLKGAWAAGGVVDVSDSAGRFLGRGFYSPRSSLVCRLLTRVDEPVDASLFHRRLEAAQRYRIDGGLVASAYRLCWSEADGLPGLVVDRYGPASVVQCLTLGMAKNAEAVRVALERVFPGDAIVRLDDPTAARIEGFDPVRESREGELIVEEGVARFAVTLGVGHKTGLYLDQRDNRALVAGLARGRRVLDAFCYAGGFTCHALLGGASSALLVDSSAEALALARRNLVLNGVEGRAFVALGNAFDALRELEARGERFGLVVLDPPPFTRRKDAVEAAARGYKEINLRGLRLLEPGGLLATFSCSHHVTAALFEDICRQAAGDAGLRPRILATLTQSRDHPVLLTVPETHYLTGLLLQLPSNEAPGQTRISPQEIQSPSAVARTK
ncbi:MAG TPA: class I SAM-dependent rRNA methyltransferase [Methylomirabilota bacterium]|nr:class I SAM-dependent rRNA methyltransferase [Methylomirabilota bacterium]